MFQITNWQKRVLKYEDNQLQPDEEIVATLVLQVKGAVKRGAIAGGMGGVAGGVTQNPTMSVIGGVVAGGRAAQGNRSQTYNVPGLAGKLPIAPLLMVLTNKNRVIVYSFVLGRLTLHYETEYKVEDLASIDVSSGFLARKATVTFSDNSALQFDLPRGHAYKPFCRVINKH